MEKTGGTKCKGVEMQVSEESSSLRENDIACGLVPVLNISITDWVVMKMLLIQTPKDFYKTSISLELAAAQWDLPREEVQKNAVKEKNFPH